MFRRFLALLGFCAVWVCGLMGSVCGFIISYKYGLNREV